MRLLPIDGAATGLQIAGRWYCRLCERLTATRTGCRLREGMFFDGLGLTLQTDLQEFLGQNVTRFQRDVFHLGEPRSPRRPLGSPEIVRQFLGDSFDVVAKRFDLDLRGTRAS